MPKETAATRRAREAVEARASQLTWEAERHGRMIRALARAQNLGLDTFLHPKGEDVHIRICSNDLGTCHDVCMNELSVWDMQCIERDLNEREDELAREQHLREVRKQVLAKLTDEEREALGV